MNPVLLRMRIAIVILAISTISLSAVVAGKWFDYSSSTTGITSEIEHIIKSESIRTYPNQEKLDEAYLKSVVAAVDDPYTQYLTKDETKAFTDSLNQTYDGIGIRFEVIETGVSIQKVFPNGPAEQAGLKVGDVITEVNNTSTKGLASEEVVNIIRGPRDSKAILNITRSGQESFQKEVVRRNIQTDLITLEIKNQIAVITINSFGNNLGIEMEKIAQRIVTSDAKRILIDVRNNGGGLLNESVTVISHFIPQNSVIIYETEKNKTTDLKSISVNNSLEKYPVDILMDKNSASASEILAGVLKYYKQATFYGTDSFGKGTVQKIFPLKNDGVLKVTVAKWLTPDKQPIPEKGYKADIFIKEVDADVVLNKTLEKINSNN
jgi:carboxyl-terminal processing protease